MNRREYSLLVENWRRFLIEGDQSGGSKFKNKFLILNDGKSGGKPAVLIGVSHDKNESIERDIPEEAKDAAEIGYYFEGAGDDVKKVKALFGGKLIKELGQWDSSEDTGLTNKDQCYTLFTGGSWNNKEWPQQVFGGEFYSNGDEIVNDGSLDAKRLEKFRKDKDKKASDVIFLMLTSTEFPTREAGGLTGDEAREVIDEIHEVVNIKNVSVKSGPEGREEFTKIIDKIHKSKLFFPGGGDEEGDFVKEVNNKRRENLLKKLKETGGIGIIGYSHLAHLQNLGKIV